MDSKNNLVTRSGSLQSMVQDIRAISETIDVEFVVQGCKIPAHRTWLAGASPVLLKLLTNGMKESFQREVMIEDVDIKTWQAVIDYIYCEPIRIDDVENAWKLLDCARRFELEQLESSVYDILASMIDETNCCDVIVRAQEMRFPNIKIKAVAVLSSKFFTLYSSQALVKLDIDTMESLLKSNALKIYGEMNVLEAVVNWLKAHGQVENHYHTSKSMYRASDSCQENSIVSRLTKYIDVYKFTNENLKNSARLCRNMGMYSLYHEIIDVILADEKKLCLLFVLRNHSACKRGQVVSESFLFSGMSWCIVVYPDGCPKEDEKKTDFCLFLRCQGPSPRACNDTDWSRRVEYKVFMVNRKKWDLLGVEVDQLKCEEDKTCFIGHGLPCAYDDTPNDRYHQNKDITWSEEDVFHSGSSGWSGPCTKSRSKWWTTSYCDDNHNSVLKICIVRKDYTTSANGDNISSPRLRCTF